MFERSRDVVAQRHADGPGAVEHDVRAGRREAAIEQHIGQVRNLDGCARRESGKLGAGHEPVQISHDVLEQQCGAAVEQS